MNQKEYEVIASAIARTNMINNMDKNSVRRVAKYQALQLLASDLVGTLCYEYPKTFDEDKFLKACGL